MSVSTSRARTRSVVALAAAGGLLTAGLTAAVSAPAAADTTGKRGLYIVQLTDLPIAAYDGRVKGYPRTSPKAGDDVDLGSAAAKKYRKYLKQQRQEALGAVSGERVVDTYTVALNGFAAQLSAADAETLERQPGVLAVTRNRIEKLNTQRTPEFLGLADGTGKKGKAGLWSRLGGPSKAGEGVLVGIIDSGIWPESKSFAGSGPVPAEYAGDCADAQAAPAPEDRFSCNSKLVIAKKFRASFSDADLLPEEYDSPRDGDGHGSHTASTAAGNHGVPAEAEGIDLGSVSGMAPAAMIGAYKVCWNGDAGGCGTVDSVAAINAAVGDGVDVLNFSISGSRTNTFNDPVERAFMFAADAGVFVATSAGNSGPGASTVAHNSPWLTTVAAGTHDRDGQGSVTLGNGTTYEGKSIMPAAGPAPLVNSSDVAKSDADPDDALLCVPGSLDPAAVDGKIVTCARGVIARTDKSLAVKQAGGVGMVLYNPSPNSVNADLHFVPAIHVDEVAGQEIVAYADTPGATASLAQGEFVYGVPAPDVAAFSSRGPALASSGDLLKPDIMAPGVDVLAAVAPPSNYERDFDFYSGTSMSSPHIAGIGALFKGRHSDWSPMAIKSALMTTSSLRRNDNSRIPGTAFDYGSGQVTPLAADNPGLVYDSGFNDWVAFACGNGDLVRAGFSPANCAPDRFGTIDPSDLNYPSIAIGDLAGIQTVSRTVTNVTDRSQQFKVVVEEPSGIDVSVDVGKFRIGPGETKTFEVTFTREQATLGEYAFGQLILDGRGKSKQYEVRSPLAVRPVALAAPEAVDGSGTSGSETWQITSGYSGSLQTKVDGLQAALEQQDTYADGNQASFDDGDPASERDNPAVNWYEVSVAEGTTYARWSTFADDTTATSDDVDLWVYERTAGGLELVGFSATGSTDETVSLPTPAAGTYEVYVHNWDSVEATNDITLSQWLLDGSDAGNAAVTAPSSVETGQTYDVTLDWSGLTAGDRYLGRVVYSDGSADVGETVVSVSTK